MLFGRKSPTKLDIQPAYDRWAEAYAFENNPIKSASNEAIKGMLPSLAGKRIIDAGCGSGYFCAYAEKHGAREILGIDFSFRMIEQARKNCKCSNFLIGNILDIELQESSAEIIICALVMGHLEKIELIVSKFSRCLTSGGILLISDFHPFLSLSGQKRTFKIGKENFEVPHYIHMLGEYTNLLCSQGFLIEQMEEPVWQNQPIIFALKAKKI